MFAAAVAAFPAIASTLVRPSVLARLSAVAFGVVLLVLGAVALAEYGARAGMDAPAGAAAADTPVPAGGAAMKVSGEILTIYEEPAESVTVMRLRGAPDLEFRAEGSLGRSFAVGEFVSLQGTKAGNVFHVDAAAKAVHPGLAAAPYFALGATILAVVALDFLVPAAIARGVTPRAVVRPLRPLFAALSRPLKRGSRPRDDP